MMPIKIIHSYYCNVQIDHQIVQINKHLIDVLIVLHLFVVRCFIFNSLKGKY